MLRHQRPDMNKLILEGLRLTTLPRLPDWITSMRISRNALTELPARLPDALNVLFALDNRLTVLPENLPSGLVDLNIQNNQLTVLPATLPRRLLYLSVQNNQLTALPETLPPALESLNVSSNRLCALPEILPPELIVLYVPDNQLTALPGTLPPELAVLHVQNNQLTALPENMPPGLGHLEANNNSLTRLPEILPPELTILHVQNNQLTALPEALPTGLRTLYVHNNRLTTLPECLVSRLQANVYVDGNPLSERTIQGLQQLLSTEGYQGSRIYFSMGDSVSHPENRPLHEAARAWLSPPEADLWQAFQTEANALAFGGFLDYLGRTRNAENPDFRARVSALLAQLAGDAGLRAMAFMVAMDATETCEDRVTYTLHHIQSMMQVSEAERGDFDSRLPALVAVGRETFRLEQIEQIAREKVKSLHFVDEIEVYLGYQNRLRESLELHTVTDEMRFFGVSGITPSDLQEAEVRIRTSEDSQFSTWFAHWAPWHRVMERIAPAVWREAVAEREGIMETEEYRSRVSAALAPLGITGDADAERAAETGVFEEMNTSLFVAATARVLAENGQASLLDKYWYGPQTGEPD